MFNKINFSRDYTFIIENLFSNGKSKILKNQDFENIAKISSSHLVMPALYRRIIKNDTNDIPVDFLKYIEKISKINNNRNLVLKSEIMKINNILERKNINHIFLKGSAMIMDNIYENCDERMVGDIDIIVKKNQLELAIKTLKKAGYINKSDYYFLENRHYPRLTKKNKLFALEVHTEILRSFHRKKINIQDVFENKRFSKNKIPIMGKKDMLMHLIYSSEINDYSYLTGNIHLRNIYDFMCYINKTKLNISEIRNDKYTASFFYKSWLILGKKYNFERKILLETRILLLNNYKILRKINNLFVKIFRQVEIRLKQIIEIFYNKNYRTYLYKKKLNKN